MLNRTAQLIVPASVLVLLVGCASTTAVNTSTQTRVDIAAQADPDPAQAEIIQIDTVSAVGQVERVLAERRRGDFPQIETEAFGFTVTEQVRISGSSFSQYDQALSLLQQDRLKEGIEVLAELTELAPELTAPYVDLGIAYRRIGDLERAAAALENAALLSPDHPIVHNELGIVYRKQGRFEQSRAAYEAALAVFGDFHFARRNLAVLCDLYLADMDCAIRNYRLYLESVGRDSDVEIWVADLAARSGRGVAGEEL
jgi:Flp pilus assembly protein TadD